MRYNMATKEVEVCIETQDGFFYPTFVVYDDEEWLYEVTEKIVQWCSHNGYSYDNIGWDIIE